MNSLLSRLESSLLVGSTLIEGSTLSEAEAEVVLAGRTVAGHPLHEVRELLNYRAAIRWLVGELGRSPYLSYDLVLDFHRQLFRGVPGEHGRTKASANFTYRSDGSRFAYEAPARVPAALQDWVDAFNADDSTEAAARAAWLYYRFEQLHPFEDGNGRIGRVLVAYWLHWKWRRPFSFYLQDRLRHLEALEAANAGDPAPLRDFVAACIARAS